MVDSRAPSSLVHTASSPRRMWTWGRPSLQPRRRPALATLGVAAILLGACQTVAFEAPPAGTSDDDAAEPAIDPIYNCDPTDTNACDGDQKCTVLEVAGVQNVYECVDDDANREFFASCTPFPTTGQDGCPSGSACVPSGADELTGFCMPLCDPLQTCDGICVPSPELDIPLCGDACSPLQKNCPIVLECHPRDDQYACQFRGDNHDGTTLDPCDAFSLDGCAEGLYCAQGSLVLSCETQNCCTPLCDTSSPTNTCSSPHECVAIPSPPPEAPTLGVCIIPA